MVLYIHHEEYRRNLLDDVKIYDIEFNDLSHIKNLSKDCFGIIKEFCGRSYYGDLTDIKINTLFGFACEHNLHTIINNIFERNDKKDIFEGRFFNGFLRACDGGHLNLLIWMKSEFPKLICGAFAEDNYAGFDNVCGYGHLNVLKWMNNNFSNRMDIAFIDHSYDGNTTRSRYTGFSLACNGGHLNILIWMKKVFPNLINDAFKCNKYNIIYDARCGCNIDVLVWLKHTFPDLINYALKYHVENRNYGARYVNKKIISWIKYEYSQITC